MSLSIVGSSLESHSLGVTPRIQSLLIKPASALCNLDCTYCFYLDRALDPYKDQPARTMGAETLEHLVDTFLFYSYPNSVFAFQGGEPTLAGLRFFRHLVRLQQEKGRNGQNVSNALQTNGTLLDAEWCKLFAEYNWLIGLSLDGPATLHDTYRVNKAAHATWKRVMESWELLRAHRVECNVLCVLSQANITQPKELYRFFKSIGADNIQYIPLAEFDDAGNPLPYTVTPEQYGRFLCETFELWWPERREVRIRFFDNLAEALAGQNPGACTLHETCDSYVVVEYNGDVYPCDFFVEPQWRLGNVLVDSWAELARKRRRYDFAAKKALPRQECLECEWRSLCHQGCPNTRHGQRGQFEDLDYFCPSYQMVFARTAGPLRDDVRKLLGR